MSEERVVLQLASVRQQCKSLRLPTVAGQCERLAEEAERERHTYLAYLEALLTGIPKPLLACERSGDHHERFQLAEFNARQV